MADSTDVSLVSHLMRLLLQSLFDGMNASGLDGDRLKQEMLKNLQKRREEAVARSEPEEMYALAQGAVLVDPDFETLLMHLLKKYRPPN